MILMRRIFRAKLKQFIGKTFLVIAFAGVGTASCTYYTNDYDPCNPSEVSFNEEIIPIFEENCNSAGCHNGTIPPNLTRDVAYVSLIGGGYVIPGDSESSTLYQVINGGSMTAYADDCDRAYIKQWIDEGAEDN